MHKYPKYLLKPNPSFNLLVPRSTSIELDRKPLGVPFWYEGSKKDYLREFYNDEMEESA